MIQFGDSSRADSDQAIPYSQQARDIGCPVPALVFKPRSESSYNRHTLVIPLTRFFNITRSLSLSKKFSRLGDNVKA